MILSPLNDTEGSEIYSRGILISISNLVEVVESRLRNCHELFEQIQLRWMNQESADMETKSWRQ